MFKHIFLVTVVSLALTGCGESQEQKQASRAEAAGAKMRASQAAMHEKNQADLRDYARRHGGK